MNERITIIQEIINRKKAKTYLEIGVKGGNCFLRIKVARKIGVDPNFLISTRSKVIHIIKNHTNFHNKYYNTTSDEFFKNIPKIIIKHGLDVIFIDGLHTYKQSLKDVFNSLLYLKSDGVIVLHDCNPLFKTAALPATSYEHIKNMNLPGWDEMWCGDVWKTIVHLRSISNNLNIFVLDCDYGLGIITKGKQENNLKYSIDQIEKLRYEDLERNREELLNLKKLLYFSDFIKNKI